MYIYKRGETVKNRRTVKITLTALLTASALVLSLVEDALPAAPFMPPGTKLGLSNVAVMFAASSLGIAETLLIVIAKAVFALITRGFTAFLMSLCGGFLSAVCMLIIFRKVGNFSFLVTGVASALCHNAGQLTVSFMLIKSAAVLGYAPVLILASLGTGILTGAILKAAMPYFSRLRMYYD